MIYTQREMDRYILYLYICIELADKAREIVVLEVVREEVTGELRGTPDDKCGVIFAPRNDVIGCRIIDQMVRFGEEWSGD